MAEQKEISKVDDCYIISLAGIHPLRWGGGLNTPTSSSEVK